MNTTTEYSPGILTTEVGMPGEDGPRDKRVQVYVSERRLKRLSVIASDRFVTGVGRASLSDLVNAIIDEWEESHPEVTTAADKRIKALG